MGANPKFTFDTEFHAGGERRTAEAERRQKKTLTVEEIEALTAAARAEGEAGAVARNGENATRELAALTISVRAACAQIEAAVANLRAEADMTLVVVAYRLATIRLADRVVFLDNGRVVATGSHDELLERPDYSSLVRAYELASAGEVFDD